MKYYCDGWCYLTNPSEIGGGYTVIDENNKLVISFEILKNGITNNETELFGVLYTFNICKDGDIIITDSNNTIKWINGVKYFLDHPNLKISRKRSRPDLDNIKLKCYELMLGKNIKLIWESRDTNLAGIYNEKYRKYNK